MYSIEQFFIQLLLNFTSAEQLNAFFNDPRTTAIIVGTLVAICGAVLGTFLLLRRMSLTSDAISHTVLLGIVLAFMVMVGILGLEPDLSSPLLILGAAIAGVATVVLTEAIQRSGLVKADAALGLAFPLLFAIAVILISRFLGNVHLDTDSVIVGEIGLAWANTNSHCLENCDEVVITPDSPKAEVGRVCINCTSGAGGINPRSPEAQFEETCANCGTYTAAEAWRDRLIDTPPMLVFFPKAVTVMALITLIVVGFVVLFYKELQLSTFDAALAAALGFRPGWLHYALMVLVSLTAVGAFDAVGSILVIAFFIIPAASAYLLTNRLWVMLVLSPIIGGLSVVLGYQFASDGLRFFFNIPDSSLPISASMALVMFGFFVAAWVFAPRQGLISTLLQRQTQQRQFADQVVLGHIYNHQHTPDAAVELALPTLHEHFRWTPNRLRWVMTRLRALNLVQVQDNHVSLTERGERQVKGFREDNLVVG